MPHQGQQVVFPRTCVPTISAMKLGKKFPLFWSGNSPGGFILCSSANEKTLCPLGSLSFLSIHPNPSFPACFSTLEVGLHRNFLNDPGEETVHLYTSLRRCRNGFLSHSIQIILCAILSKYTTSKKPVLSARPETHADLPLWIQLYTSHYAFGTLNSTKTVCLPGNASVVPCTQTHFRVLWEGLAFDLSVLSPGI